MATAAMREIVKRNELHEERARKDKAKRSVDLVTMKKDQEIEELKKSHTLDNFIGAAAAISSAGVAGYIDGRLDLQTDGKEGDGITVLGAPVMAATGMALGLGGLFLGGRGGSAAAWSGVGVLSGKFYSRNFHKGQKDAEKALEEA